MEFVGSVFMGGTLMHGRGDVEGPHYEKIYPVLSGSNEKRPHGLPLF